MPYTILSVLKDMGMGNLKLTSSEIREKRLVTCLSCEFFGSILRTCSICSCNVDGKTWLEKSTCPKGKW